MLGKMVSNTSLVEQRGSFLNIPDQDMKQIFKELADTANTVKI